MTVDIHETISLNEPVVQKHLNGTLYSTPIYAAGQTYRIGQMTGEGE